MTLDCCNDDDHQDDQYGRRSSGTDNRDFECIQGFQQGRGVITFLVSHIHSAPGEHRFVEIQLLLVPVLFDNLHPMVRKVDHLSIPRLDRDGIAVNEGGLEGASEGEAEFGVRGNCPLFRRD